MRRHGCRPCEKVTQPSAPFHITPRGMFGPAFLAPLLFDQFGQQQPLNRQHDGHAREGKILVSRRLPIRPTPASPR